MTITPGELFDTSLAQLQVLTAFLSDRLGEAGAGRQVQSDALEVRACREILLSLSAPISKVQGARRAPSSAASDVRELGRKVSSFARYAKAKPIANR
jgi:hypothetical protein